MQLYCISFGRSLVPSWPHHLWTTVPASLNPSRVMVMLRGPRTCGPGRSFVLTVCVP